VLMLLAHCPSLSLTPLPSTFMAYWEIGNTKFYHPTYRLSIRLI
jgi:hypothetical protein